MSQKQQLAAAVGVTNSRVSRWEAGLAEPTIDEAVRIARATGVDLMWLLGLEDGATAGTETDTAPYVPQPQLPGLDHYLAMAA